MSSLFKLSPKSSIYKFIYKRTITFHLITSFCLHLLLIWFGEIQDQWLDVRFTDIDYNVFTDGAQHVLQGGSPFERDTYRYTPFLAWLMVPNLTWFPQFGKILFSLFDVLGGYVIYSILSPNVDRQLCSLLWLYNPFIAIISTRGSCESLICTLVIATIFLISKKYHSYAGLLYGLVIHFKIYPIIYALSFFLGKELGTSLEFVDWIDFLLQLLQVRHRGGVDSWWTKFKSSFLRLHWLASLCPLWRPTIIVVKFTLMKLGCTISIVKICNTISVRTFTFIS